jgi:hypothetical protein
MEQARQFYFYWWRFRRLLNWQLSVLKKTTLAWILKTIHLSWLKLHNLFQCLLFVVKSGLIRCILSIRPIATGSSWSGNDQKFWENGISTDKRLRITLVIFSKVKRLKEGNVWGIWVIFFPHWSFWLTAVIWLTPM